MFIERVIMEGFKSYATRTEVSGFDPRFNAITGLNGSGKSNVLDAICFVLGITNLSQVRVGKLQELVYKQGQAGITKATVTVVFNNDDRSQCPVGYEDYDKITVTREIAIGGRNKYSINGHQAKTGRVNNLFHSVQLNVNNPHFLIMQGRITKVINMKKEETLSLVEEAAGTRMYEDKRAAAMKTMEKKEIKVEEINRILREDITPTLERLQKERAEMMRFLSNNADIERLTRLVVAHDYVQAIEMQGKYAAKVEALAAELEAVRTRAGEAGVEAKAITDTMSKLAKSKDAELEGEYKLRLQAKEVVGKELVTATSKRDNKQLAVDDEVQALEALLKTATEEEARAAEKATTLERQATELSTHQELLRQRSQEAEALQRTLQAASAGMTEGEDGDACTVGEQLMKAQAAVNELTTELRGCELRRDDAAVTMKECAKDTKGAEKEVKSLRAQIAKKNKALDAAKARLASAAYDPQRERVLTGEKDRLEAEIFELQEARDQLWAKLAARLEFNYDVKAVMRGFPGFDPASVKGVVAEMVQVKSPEVMTALETVAGGRLFNIVVDDHSVGTALLKHGKLRRRVTIIPLDKVNPRTISDVQMRAAGRAVGDKARPALTLVGYPEDVEKAMEFVFGNSFVCETSEAAREVTFNKSVARRERCRSVTLGGDVFDPSGTAEGGAPPRAGAMLVEVSKLNDMNAALDGMKARLAAVDKELAAMADASTVYSEASGAIEVQSHEVHLLEQQLGESQFAQLQDKMAALQAQVDAETEALQRVKAQLKDATQAVKRLEREAANVEQARTKRIKEVERAIAMKKKEVSSAEGLVRTVTQVTQELELELASSQTERTTMEEQIEAAQAAVDKAKAQVAELDTIVSEVQTRFDAAEREEQEQRRQIDECDAELKRLGKALAVANKEVKDTEVATKKMQHKRSRMQADSKNAAALVKQLEAEHGKFIEDEKQFFGRAGTVYDFEAQNVKEAGAKLKALEKEQASLSKRVNKKAMGMMETAEKEYQDVMNKKRIIENDKKKIVDVIKELDQKKNEALKVTHEKVNEDFGSIFSELLPGSMAKLEPPEGGTVLDGLEVKVGFGDVWKASLSELSGGQRSLLALSLILALLRFKPAPMYILDEVDAALDLSHTQNIGTVLRKHFGMSQFIVVSLKEGMFNNANVVFRTKFVDGVSTIRRTIPSAAIGRAAIADAEVEEENEVEPVAAAGAAAGAGRKARAKKAPAKKSARTTSRRTASKV